VTRSRAELSVAGTPGGLLDEPGKAIVRQLQQDGRRSYTAIAAAVGLSEAAVRARVKGLVESGTVKIVAITDPLQLGFGMMAMAGISVSGDTRAVADALAAIDEVDYVVLTSGRFDIMIEVICRDNEHLLELLNERVRTVDGVRETETFVSLRVHKETYNWGTL
jgi:Lrp/AsnC family transcriptional regulator, regulator for asnA, asnC and gidA